MSVYYSMYCVLASLWFVSISAFAGISLDGTRIIFPASSSNQGQSIGVTSSQQSTVPYLVKAQVLADVYGEQQQTPFSVTPSLFRLEPGNTNQLRVLKTGQETLPQNKESIFYLRVIAVPAGTKGETNSKTELGGSITVSTGTIIKLFYRPEGLSMTHKKAMSSLQFLRRDNALLVKNPSPYFITLSSLSIDGKALAVSVRKQNTTIAPFSEMSYPDMNALGKVTWQSINDYGGTELFHGSVQ